MATQPPAAPRGIAAFAPPMGQAKGEYHHENGMCIHHSRGETAHS